MTHSLAISFFMLFLLDINHQLKDSDTNWSVQQCNIEYFKINEINEQQH